MMITVTQILALIDGLIERERVILRTPGGFANTHSENDYAEGILVTLRDDILADKEPTKENE